MKIKFGTDGWRAIIARDFTEANVARVAKATAIWLNERYDSPKVAIGYDCRFGGKLFSTAVIKVLANEGIKCLVSPDFSSTPMISLAAHDFGCQMGVVITASHNPPDYNGYKLKSGYGGPTSPKEIAEVEALIPESAEIPDVSLTDLESKGLLEYVDFESHYLKKVEENFDLNSIRNSGIGVAYDAMYGAGQRIVDRILPAADLLHADFNPSFRGQAPEPLHKNLQELSGLIANDESIHFGFATDGDADRLGIYDEDGNFVDAHHVILLLVHILAKYKGMSGKVVVAFSVSDKVRKLCEAYGLEHEVTKIGFKYICEVMLKSDVLVGGEESGGIAVKGHIPERDGVWDALLILEHSAKSGKTIKELIAEVYEVVGGFCYNRNDLHIDEKLKQQIVQNCKDGKYTAFGDYQATRIEDIDGYKFFFKNDATVMIRPSGTEPVLRVYAEASSEAEVQSILKATETSLLHNS